MKKMKFGFGRKKGNKGLTRGKRFNLNWLSSTAYSEYCNMRRQGINPRKAYNIASRMRR